MILWMLSAILRSDGGISAILARQSASASALFQLAFRSLISSFMAAFSSAVKTLDAALRAGFFVAGIGTSPARVVVAWRSWRHVLLHLPESVLRGAQALAASWSRTAGRFAPRNCFQPHSAPGRNCSLRSTRSNPACSSRSRVPLVVLSSESVTAVLNPGPFVHV